MVDNRSAGFFGIGGGFNFRSGDISGTAARTSDDKAGQGDEYFAQDGESQEQQQPPKQPYVDRSAQLRATLSSLAMMNVANLLNLNKRPKYFDEIDIEQDLGTLNVIENTDDTDDNENSPPDQEEQEDIEQELSQ